MNKNRKHIYLLLLGIILTVLIVFGSIIVKQRAFSYGYNQRQNYLYRFNTFYAEILECKLDNNRLLIPTPNDEFSTAFIEIAIQSTLKGFFNEPEVIMTAGNDSLIQNFECGAKGIRYLNISQLIQKGATEVQFKFSGCKPHSSTIKLIAYKNINPAKEKILILSPHPDDAEIAAYGVYASNPKNSFIVTVTAGDAGSMHYREVYSDSTKHYLKKGQIRAWNSITVPMLAGVPSEQSINLGYFDASLQKMYNDTLSEARSRNLNTTDISLFRSANCSHLPDSLTPSSTWRSLVNDLKYLLVKVSPTIVITTYPAIDYHLDHKYTTVALHQAMQEIVCNNSEIWLYTNHLPLTSMYPDGKIRSQISLPPYFEQIPMYFDKICSFPLTKDLQNDKIIALDAMNDLRPNTQYHDIKASWLQFKNNTFNKLYLKESDYFRRSVRSNEFFFVIEPGNFNDRNIFNKIQGNIEKSVTNHSKY